MSEETADPEGGIDIARANTHELAVALSSRDIGGSSGSEAGNACKAGVAEEANTVVVAEAAEVAAAAAEQLSVTAAETAMIDTAAAATAAEEAAITTAKTALLHSVRVTHASQDLVDYQQLIDKRASHRTSSSIKDIADCNRLPQLRTRLLVPDTYSAAWKDHHLNGVLGGDMDGLGVGEMSMGVGALGVMGGTGGIGGTGPFSRSEFEARSDLGGAKRVLSLRQQVSYTYTPQLGEENESDRLSRVLEYMTQARQVLDSSRLYYEAAINFQAMGLPQRASHCFAQCIRRVPAATVVDAYDLPSNSAYLRRVKYISSFQLPKFLKDRADLRDKLINLEDERQRLRSLESHFQLALIHLITDELVDLPRAHKHLMGAFSQCASQSDHSTLLLRSHSLLKDFASLKRVEMPLSKQLLRQTAGPIAEAHLRILLELQLSQPENADIQEWLGYRYTEKGDLETAQGHFLRLRECLNPPQSLEETRGLWGTTGMGGVRMRGTGLGCGGMGMGKVPARDPQQLLLDQRIVRNITKQALYSFDSQGGISSFCAGGATGAAAAIKEIQARSRRSSNASRSPHSPHSQTSDPSRNFTNLGRDVGTGAPGIGPLIVRTAAIGNTGPKVGTVEGSKALGGEKPGDGKGTSLHRQIAQYSRQDLAWFGGRHEHCTTVFYAQPKQGWNTLPIPGTPSSHLHPSTPSQPSFS